MRDELLALTRHGGAVVLPDRDRSTLVSTTPPARWKRRKARGLTLVDVDRNAA